MVYRENESLQEKKLFMRIIRCQCHYVIVMIAKMSIFFNTVDKGTDLGGSRDGITSKPSILKICWNLDVCKLRYHLLLITYLSTSGIM